MMSERSSALASTYIQVVRNYVQVHMLRQLRIRQRSLTASKRLWRYYTYNNNCSTFNILCQQVIYVNPNQYQNQLLHMFKFQMVTN